MSFPCQDCRTPGRFRRLIRVAGGARAGVGGHGGGTGGVGLAHY
jgi:hypothetical protein